MSAPPESNVQTGVCMASEGVMVRVSESPLFPLPEPDTASTTADSVGTVSSWVTPLPEVTAVTAVPALPAVSVKPIEKTIAPSASES